MNVRAFYPSKSNSPSQFVFIRVHSRLNIFSPKNIKLRNHNNLTPERPRNETGTFRPRSSSHVQSAPPPTPTPFIPALLPLRPPVKFSPCSIHPRSPQFPVDILVLTHARLPCKLLLVEDEQSAASPGPERAPESSAPNFDSREPSASLRPAPESSYSESAPSDVPRPGSVGAGGSDERGGYTGFRERPQGGAARGRGGRGRRLPPRGGGRAPGGRPPGSSGGSGDYDRPPRLYPRADELRSPGGDYHDPEEPPRRYEDGPEPDLRAREHDVEHGHDHPHDHDHDEPDVAPEVERADVDDPDYRDEPVEDTERELPPRGPSREPVREPLRARPPERDRNEPRGRGGDRGDRGGRDYDRPSRPVERTPERLVDRDRNRPPERSERSDRGERVERGAGRRDDRYERSGSGGSAAPRGSSDPTLYRALRGQLDRIRHTLESVLRDLERATQTLAQAEQDHQLTEQEMEALRQQLEGMQRGGGAPAARGPRRSED